MSEFKASGFSDEFGSSGPDIVGITTFTSPYYFVPPSGSTAERPSSPPPGMLRFNTDIGRLEVWRNDHWATILGESPNLGNHLVTNSAGGTGTRGVFMGGGNPTGKTDIDYITIATLGNAQDFGDLSGAERGANNGQIASRTRGLMIGGGDPSNGDVEKLIFSSTGSSVDSGLNFTARRLSAGCSNQTRGILAGGYDNPSGADNNIIECTEISSLGSKQDFGDLTLSRYFPSGVSSSVRGIFIGGVDAGVDEVNIIDYITISTTGNAQDFGDMSEKGRKNTASNSTRGVLAGGYRDPGANTNVIEFITIATTGNSQDFGDMDVAKRDAAAVSSPIRMVIAAGYDGSSFYDAMDYITILTTGNSIDFGDLVGTDRFRPTGASNGHGGL